MNLNIKVLLDKKQNCKTEDKEEDEENNSSKLTIESDGTITFVIKELDVYKANTLAISILEHASKYKSQDVSIDVEGVDEELVSRLVFQLEIYNKLNKEKDILNLSYKFNVPKMSKMLETIQKVFKDYFEVVRLPANIINCDSLVLRYREALRQHNLDNVVKFREVIVDESSDFKAIYAVGKAGKEKPRLVVIEFGEGSGKEKNEFDVAICGKGVCYDTGGLSLKPNRSMLDMYIDMAGSALGFYASLCYYIVFGGSLLYATGIVENAIGSSAYRPGDVIDSYSKKKIFIGNTDAEGRLVLADVLAYVSSDYKVKHIITLATLTGAAIIVCGPDYCPYVPISGDYVESMINELKPKVGEYLISLPKESMFIKGYISNAGPFADIANTVGAAGGYEGSHGPGHFLSYFIKDLDKKVAFTHFDIANYFDTRTITSARRSTTDLLEFIATFVNQIVVHLNKK